MKLENIYNILILLLMLCLGSSCSQNEQANPIVTDNGDISVMLSFRKATPARATDEIGREELNENKINTIDVFIYKEGTERCAFYQHIIPGSELTGVGEYRAKLAAYQETFELNATYYTYVIANYTGTIPANGFSLTLLKNLSVTGLNPDRKQDAFLMDGTAAGMVLNDGIIVNKEIPVSLKRAASKIRVKLVYTNGYTPLESGIVAKRLMRYAPDSRAIEAANPFVPALRDMPDFTTTMTGASADIAFVLYSYANDWNTDANNETYMILDIPVEGTDGQGYAHNYYRVPVNYRLPESGDMNTAEPLYKLQRNYLYDITVQVDKSGSPDPGSAVELTTSYTIQDWTTKEVLVAVEGFNFLYVEDTRITMPNSTMHTMSFQSSTPVTITDIQVNGKPYVGSGVNITWTKDAKSGNIVINSTLPNNFVAKELTFTVKNASGLTQDVYVQQFPALYIGYDISADEPDGSAGQNNNKMFIINTFVADFSTLPDPDEFDEDFGPGYTHLSPNPALGKSYAEYIRKNAVLGYPRLDSDGNTLDTEENNRMVSPRFMLASQHGTTTAGNYWVSRAKCSDYVERDRTTGETYTDWRMPTLAESYIIDILQNIRLCEVKKILEGKWYWSAQQSRAVEYMDPRVGTGTSFDALKASVRCVRDVKVK